MLDGIFDLTGRTALVTGGSRGIGRMIARGFLEQGATVYICARKREACDAAAAALDAEAAALDAARAPGRAARCISLPADLSSVQGARDLAARLAALAPRLDILVNNAGAAWAAPFDDFPESGWDKVVDLNLKSPFFLTQALAAQLRAAASPARPAKVINIASIDGIFVNPLETYPYAASKAGLIHLTRRMAARLAREHIVVTAIAPGPFGSDMNRDARDQPDAVAARVPVGRVGRDEDMAAAAVYLASRAGDYVVGATLTVDGGVAFARTGFDGERWEG
ncbi:MAG: SDR family oxidoreductase [Lautropia sp.]